MRHSMVVLIALSLAPIVGATGQRHTDLATRFPPALPSRFEPLAAPSDATPMLLWRAPLPAQPAFSTAVTSPGGAKKGALIGGGIGLGVGVLGGILANAVCTDLGEDPCPEAIPLFGIGGALLGAGIGALIGQ